MMRDTILLHLANVLAIAEADGTFSAPENAAVGDIMARIRANDNDLAAARALLERDPPYRLQALPDPAENMRMIEDMVLMSLADGHVSPYESRPLDAFLSDLGFVQADMDMIVQRVRARLHNIPPPLPKTSSPPPLRREGETRPSIPSERGSPAPHQPAAPKGYARPAPKQTPPSAPAKKIRQPPPVEAVPATELEVERLAQPRATGALEPTDTPISACARARTQSSFGACYCFGCPESPLNPWGCRLLDMAWTDDAPWLRFGAFHDDDSFVFDREAIARHLRQRLATVADCPFLLAGFAEHALSALPSRATTAGRWRHHLASQTTVSAAVPVTIRTYRHGCSRQVVALSDGLSPTDDRDARLMIRRTALRTRTPLDLAQLDERQGGQS